MGSAWIGTEQVSNQLQGIVDSIRLNSRTASTPCVERERTAADILGLSEVGSFSIIRRDEMRIIRIEDLLCLLRDLQAIHREPNPSQKAWLCSDDPQLDRGIARPSQRRFCGGLGMESQGFRTLASGVD